MKMSHGHDNHVVADATGEKGTLWKRRTQHSEEEHKAPLTFLRCRSLEQPVSAQASEQLKVDIYNFRVGPERPEVPSICGFGL